MKGELNSDEQREYYIARLNKNKLAGGVTATPHRENMSRIDEEERQLALKCCLCKRNRPVFAGDDDIKRMPETSMSKFLRMLKLDAIKKQRYLSMLRVTPKFIQACSCPQSVCHSYCLTANII